MRPVIVSLILLLCHSSNSQSLTGSWYGKANVSLNGHYNNYLTELVIKQKGDDIEGIFGYYFRDGYKSLFIRGKYNKKSRKLDVQKIPLTYFRALSVDGVDCMMDFYGTVMISKVHTTIKGVFVTDPRYRYTCPGISANYTLDFTEKNQDSLIRNSISRKLWQPQQNDVVINTTNTTNPKQTQASGEKPSAPTPDMVTQDQPLFQHLLELMEKRQTVLSKDIEIKSDSVRISFYDNGDIDGDSISVFLNKKPILVNQALTAEAMNIYIKLDAARDVNEITMYAENLGVYPPNTALMTVSDGEQRHEVYLSSSLSQNASVRLRRSKK
ncbi:MAG: hypothetical protein WKF97_20360 [Chitinophagaceae bacterium]